MNGTIFRVSICFILSVIAGVSLSAQVHNVAYSVPLRATQEVTRIYSGEMVDVKPMFPGGDMAMLNYINKERRYPQDAYRDRIEGRVTCRFVVGVDGSISDIVIVRGAVIESLNVEAVRILSNMPRWNVGTLRGEAVPVYCYVTIPFRL